MFVKPKTKSFHKHQCFQEKPEPEHTALRGVLRTFGVFELFVVVLFEDQFEVLWLVERRRERRVLPQRSIKDEKRTIEEKNYVRARFHVLAEGDDDQLQQQEVQPAVVEPVRTQNIL